MPPKKLTPIQTAKLRTLESVHADYVSAKATLRAEVEAQFEQRLRDFELRESRLMNEAKQAGVPKTVIGRAVGLANWEVLEAKYSLTAEEFLKSLSGSGPDFTLTDRKDAGGWRIVLVHWYVLPTGEVVNHPTGGSEWTVETFTDQLDSRKKHTALVEPEDTSVHDEFTKRAMNWLSKNPQSFRDWQADITNRILAEIDKEGY